MRDTVPIDAIAILADRMRTYARVLDLMAAEAAQHARAGDGAAALNLMELAEHNLTALSALRSAILHIGEGERAPVGDAAAAERPHDVVSAHAAR